MLSTIPMRMGSYDPTQSHIVQSFMPGAGEHYALPAGITKGSAIETMTQALRRMGGTSTEILFFRAVANYTLREAWHDVTTAPMNWRKQSDLAQEIGVSDRQVRRIEQRLEDLGVLARSTPANGYRGFRRGQSRATPASGLSLEPALANYHAFALLVETHAQDEEARRDLICDIRRAEGRVKRVLAGLEGEALRHQIETLWADVKTEARPKGGLSDKPTDRLAAWSTEIESFEERLRALQDGCAATEAAGDVPSSETGTPRAEDTDQGEHTEAVSMEGIAPAEPARDATQTAQAGASSKGAIAPVGKLPCRTSMSAAPDMDVRCHIQPVKKLKESCYARGPRAAPPNSPHPDTEVRPKGLEKSAGPCRVSVNDKVLKRLKAGGLQELMSAEAEFYLTTQQDWRRAIPPLLREIGVTPSAWDRAVTVMGQEMALLTLIVLDRNRYHPKTPIRSPGAALRIFTRCAENGTLDLTRTIIGIWERGRQGTQPKGPQDLPPGRRLS